RPLERGGDGAPRWMAVQDRIRRIGRLIPLSQNQEGRLAAKTPLNTLLSGSFLALRAPAGPPRLPCPVEKLTSPSPAVGHQVPVDAEREARVLVTEEVSQRPDVASALQEHARVVMPQRM